jgi:hypothetical protein
MMSSATRWKVLAGGGAVLVLAAGLSLWPAAVSPDVVKEKIVPASTALAGDVTKDELEKVARTRVFFGHQSVGMNVLDALPGLYAEHGLTAPPIEQGGASTGPDGGFITHAYIGENEKPLGKIRDFDAKLRGGLADQVDVAMMKFCYIDIRAATDVDGLFAAYRDTLAALERDFPRVTFLKVTVPLTTEAGLTARLRTRLGRDVRFGQAENVVREQLNQLIRQEYAGDQLFDLAAAESTTSDGTLPTGRFEGQAYHTLLQGYAADEGHLNATGARRVAAAWVKAVAQVGPQ